MSDTDTKTGPAPDNAEAYELQPCEFLNMASGRLPDGDGGVKAIIDLTNKAAEVELIKFPTEGLGEGLPPNVPILIDHRPSGLARGIRDIVESYRTQPERRKGTLKTTTLESFIAAVNRHKDADSVVFAKTSWPQPSLTAVIDYHTAAGGPRWGQHHIGYDFPITPELKAWIENNGKPMQQADFAAFLEEHAAELTAPYDAERIEYERLFKERFALPNELIDLSRSLEVFVNAKVKSANRLQSGERVIEFTEEHMNGKGEKIDIPGLFMTQMRAFVDGDPVQILARLRYRAAAGGVSWFYQLYRWDVALRQRVQNDLLLVAKGTGLQTFEGFPETSAA